MSHVFIFTCEARFQASWVACHRLLKREPSDRSLTPHEQFGISAHVHSEERSANRKTPALGRVHAEHNLHATSCDQSGYRHVGALCDKGELFQLHTRWDVADAHAKRSQCHRLEPRTLQVADASTPRTCQDIL